MEYIEYIFVVLVSFMGICFFINMITVEPNYGLLFKGIFVPSIPAGSEDDMISLIGCVIMPHNLYLHSSLVQTRKINRNNKKQVKETIIYFILESALTLFMSFVINLCVITTFAHYYDSSDDIKNNINLQTAGN